MAALTKWSSLSLFALALLFFLTIALVRKEETSKIRFVFFFSLRNQLDVFYMVINSSHTMLISAYE